MSITTWWTGHKSILPIQGVYLLLIVSKGSFFELLLRLPMLHFRTGRGHSALKQTKNPPFYIPAPFSLVTSCVLRHLATIINPSRTGGGNASKNVGRQAGLLRYIKCWQFREAGRVAYILCRRSCLPTYILCRQSCLPTNIFGGTSAASSRGVNAVWQRDRRILLLANCATFIAVYFNKSCPVISLATTDSVKTLDDPIRN